MELDVLANQVEIIVEMFGVFITKSPNFLYNRIFLHRKSPNNSSGEHISGQT